MVFAKGVFLKRVSLSPYEPYFQFISMSYCAGPIECKLLLEPSNTEPCPPGLHIVHVYIIPRQGYVLDCFQFQAF